MNIIITGATKGIGKAIASCFANEGNTIFLCSRSEEELNKTALEIKEKYPNCVTHFKAADLSEKDAAIEFGQWCLSFGVPNILVNNAGNFLQGNISNEADGNLEAMIKTNLYSAYHVTRTVLPKMIAQKNGHIFNICSIASLKAYDNGGAYSISKFALMGFSKNLREELKDKNIKVTSVYPGAVLTNSWNNFDNTNKRIMEVEDIATLVLASSKLSIQAVVEDIIIRPQLGDL